MSTTKQLTSWNDTIVALEIKLFKIVNELFPAKDLLKKLSNTQHIGFLKDDKIILDGVVLSLYRLPKSYTGEDVIKISCHGSPFIQQQIIAACVASMTSVGQTPLVSSF